MDRRRAVEESVRSGEMEGASVSAQFARDAEEYAKGGISADDLVRRTKRRWHPGESDWKAASCTADSLVDPYLDPVTGILRNLAGARTHEELRNAEDELVSARTVQLLTALSFRASGAFSDLRAIRRWLFQDLYGWPARYGRSR